MSALYTIDKASAKEEQKPLFASFTYNVLYLPRTHQICNDNYVGVSWDFARKYEKRCRILWTEWAKEMREGLPFIY